MRQILTKRSLLGVALVAASVCLMFWPLGAPASAASAAGSETTTAPAAGPPLPVALQEVVAVAGWQESSRYTGTVNARRTSPLGFERGGRLVEVMVDTGDSVERGEVLARLDAERFRIQRAEAVAALEVEQARLEEAQAGPRPQTIQQARAEVERWESEVARLERESERRVELLARGVSAEEEAESLAYAARAARAGREAARQQLNELEAGTRREQIAAQQAGRDLAAARLAQLDLEIERSALLAPYSGIVLDRAVDEGVVLDAGTPVLHLQESAALEARIGVPAAIAATLQEGQQYELSLGSVVAAGTLRAALPQIDRQTRSRILVFDLENRDAFPGATAAWSTTIEHKGAGHLIPSTALVPSRRGLWAVYLYDENDADLGRLVRQEVTVLHAESDAVVVSGLQDGDRVVAAGTDRVVPGQAVRAQAE